MQKRLPRWFGRLISEYNWRLDSRNITIIFLGAVLMIMLYGQIDHTIKPYSMWDLSAYKNMALSSPSINIDIQKPQAYRILGPFLIGLFPIPLHIGFYIFSVIFSIFLVIQFYCLLRYMGLSSDVSMITVFLFMFNKYFFGFTVWNYFQINDIISLNIIIVLFLSMWEGQWMVFGVALVLGAITKEVSMLVVPILFIYLIETKCLTAKWRKALAAITPGILVFILIRILIPATGGEISTSVFLDNFNKIYSPESIFNLLINPFIPLILIPLVYFKSTVEFFKARKYALVFVCLVVFSAMFGPGLFSSSNVNPISLFGSNNVRLMAPAFIVFYMLIGIIFESINKGKVFYSLILVFGLLSSFHHVYGIYPLPDRGWVYSLSLVSTIVITGTMYIKKGAG